MKKLQKGFTLIELLVVIAIIGILSSVVLASLNSARNKGADAAAKANLANIRAQAAIFYEEAGTYDDGDEVVFCGDTVVAAALAAAATASGGTTSCQDDAEAWAVSSPLKSSTTEFWCVDSTGAATEISANLAAGDVTCGA